ncbi:MAG TPA: hypothetical protein VFA23_01195 [Dongiaceae bacterium]|nr:hypothetical protein [Dongiaceae bacterium]
MTDGGGDRDDRDRVKRSFAALALAVVLVVAGLYLLLRLHKANELEMCLEAGHRNCDALMDTP